MTDVIIQFISIHFEINFLSSKKLIRSGLLMRLSYLLKMTETYKKIQLNTQFVHLRLGGVLQQCLTSYELAHIFALSVSVANDVWYGNFSVPTAVGFSTPVSLLQGGSLFVSMSEVEYDSQLIQLYQQWSSSYSGTGLRKVTKQTFTTDKMTCHICLNDYVVGDHIYQLDSCGHVFHLECIGQWILHNCSICREFGSFQFHCVHMENTLVSHPTRCPLCQAKTII